MYPLKKMTNLAVFSLSVLLKIITLTSHREYRVVNTQLTQKMSLPSQAEFTCEVQSSVLGDEWIANVNC